MLTKAPLVVPPDYNLMPPKPGAAPTNQIQPTDAAQTALFGSDPATVASNIPGNSSQGEKLLLAYAGMANADPNIRQELDSDRKAMVGSDDSFTDELLFWQGPKADTGKRRRCRCRGQTHRSAKVRPDDRPSSQDGSAQAGRQERLVRRLVRLVLKNIPLSRQLGLRDLPNLRAESLGSGMRAS